MTFKEAIVLSITVAAVYTLLGIRPDPENLFIFGTSLLVGLFISVVTVSRSKRIE